MRITLLSVPDCPNVALMVERLRSAGVTLEGDVDVVIVRTEADAAHWGMAGSPTVLLDGVDPFADATSVAALGCRLYRDASGAACGAPSVEQLRDALTAPTGPTGRRR